MGTECTDNDPRLCFERTGPRGARSLTKQPDLTEHATSGVHAKILKSHPACQDAKKLSVLWHQIGSSSRVTNCTHPPCGAQPGKEIGSLHASTVADVKPGMLAGTRPTTPRDIMRCLSSSESGGEQARDFPDLVSSNSQPQEASRERALKPAVPQLY